MPEERTFNFDPAEAEALCSEATEAFDAARLAVVHLVQVEAKISAFLDRSGMVEAEDHENPPEGLKVICRLWGQLPDADEIRTFAPQLLD